MNDEIRQTGCGPVAINSKLGLLLSRPLSSTDYHNIASTNLIISYIVPTKDDELVCSLKGFWEIEAVGITDVSPTQTSTDQFLDRITFTSDRYEVSLPWREGPVNFSDHYMLSLNCLRSLHRCLPREPPILNEYEHILQDQLSQGIIDRVPESQVTFDCSQQTHNMVHYLPHQGVSRYHKALHRLG